MTLLLCSQTWAQGEFSLTADVRSRFEYRHGFSTLFPDDADPAAFVNQRTRLNLQYNNERLKLFMSVQDVSTWGDTPQILPTDGNDSFSLFQAWAQLLLNENWSIKAGRQVLSYDDQRILGGLDWAMQGRFHDALLVKYAKNKLALDIGGAFNQEKTANFNTAFTTQGAFSYKSMQYFHLHQEIDKAGLSILFLNTGFQKFTNNNYASPNGVAYRQTAGAYTTFPIGMLKFEASGYYQFGKFTENSEISAYQISLDGSYKTNNVLFGLGMEMLSGTDQNGDSKIKSFIPLYGTNHKFNGYMDYFYVGNHAYSVGLNDLHARVNIGFTDRSNLLIKAHYFIANANLALDADPYLGTEIDLVFTQKILKDVKLDVGYSHMFASESMSLIKAGAPHDNTNNWAWAQLSINPSLFNTKKD